MEKSTDVYLRYTASFVLFQRTLCPLRISSNVPFGFKKFQPLEPLKLNTIWPLNIELSKD